MDKLDGIAYLLNALEQTEKVGRQQGPRTTKYHKGLITACLWGVCSFQQLFSPCILVRGWMQPTY